MGMLAAASVIILFMVSCGKQENEVVSEQAAEKKFVYVPEYILGDANFYNIEVAGSSMYYSKYSYDEAAQTSETSMMSYSLETGEEKKLDISFEENRSVLYFTVDQEGNVYTAEYSYADMLSEAAEEAEAAAEAEEKQLLCKYDAQGNTVYEQNITEIMQSDENNSWINRIVADGQGRLYVASDNIIRLFDAEGNFYGNASMDKGWIQSMGCGKDGKIYVTYYDTTSAEGGIVLSEVNYDGKQLGQTYVNFPNSNGNGKLSAGFEKDILVSDENKVYEYDLATQTYEEVLTWLDSDINGSYVNYVGVLENGKLLVQINDWNTGKTELACLTKTDASTLPEKTELVIGTLAGNSNLQAAAVAFNRKSDTCHIRIKTYIDQNNWTETSWKDGITALNNDILSKENCPDILDLTSLSVEQLAAKGVFADLTPYLESSKVFQREDFLQNVLDGYTFDGKLVSIPCTFSMATVIGKTAEVGTESGWTMEEMMAYAEKHPDAALFDGYGKKVMLNVMMNYNQNAFVDWEKGECKFDSEEFKTILNFVNTFPDEYDFSDERSTPVKIQAGDVLLETVYIYDLQSIQEYEARFNEPITYIGYPNADGTSGCYITGNDVCAVSAKSEHPEEAWSFMESFLESVSENEYSYGLPANKNYLEQKIAKETKVEYALDENGEKLLDENGEPITVGGSSSVGYGDWEYTFHVPTEEEIAKIKELMENAAFVFNSNSEIMEIISEESEAFFKGQKTVDDVAGIIQSRVQIYVNENR